MRRERRKIRFASIETRCARRRGNADFRADWRWEIPQRWRFRAAISAKDFTRAPARVWSARMKRKLTRMSGLWAAIVFLAGCSSPQFSRIDSNRPLYESWPLEVRQAVLDGRAEPGMDPEMVKMALGKPTEIVPGSNPAEEIWVYRSGGEDFNSGMYPGGYPANTGGTIGIGSGGVIVAPSVNTNVGPVSIGTGGGGVMSPMPMPASPVVEREVVFRDGLVYRADNPPPK
jgi:hypothetical protein